MKTNRQGSLKNYTAVRILIPREPNLLLNEDNFRKPWRSVSTLALHLNFNIYGGIATFFPVTHTFSDLLKFSF